MNKDVSLFDGYFVRIKVNKLGKKLHFPLQSLKNEDDVLNYTNELVGQTIYIDKVALEDFVKFQ